EFPQCLSLRGAWEFAKSRSPRVTPKRVEACHGPAFFSRQPVVASIVSLVAAPGMFSVFIPWYSIGWHMVGRLLGLERLRFLGG
ncbi:hypothetical protein ACCT11_35845, partial [Rhizobium johnstonii]|uniref:hypothetical protein n=1 Tax=Rhizobium johnstonii TaxID=3019933 RepID=UPI003F949653